MVQLTESDLIVLKDLAYDIHTHASTTSDDSGSRFSTDEDHVKDSISLLRQIKNESTAFTTWDTHQINATVRSLCIVPYISWASTIVRNPADTVFITHILLDSAILLPSTLYLYVNFTWIHGLCHLLTAVYFCGSWTILLHNHIHNNGILRKEYRSLDQAFPYLLGPLMGHTWNSYYNHHVKMHHIESNGPKDISSTIYYQRDSVVDFMKYLSQFVVLTWIELPLYFFAKKDWKMGLKALFWEVASLSIIAIISCVNLRPSIFALILPLLIMRIGMVVGNWGQHCFVDEVDPKSDFRSSITVIDVASNRFCFNDGYHTSHHLNSTRHWRDHPVAFLEAKEKYQNEGALVFQGIDYLMMTVRVLSKDYDCLAKHLVPIGSQIAMTHGERVAMLRSKTRKFTREDIELKFK